MIMDTNKVPAAHQEGRNTWYESTLLSSAVKKIQKEFDFFRVEVPTEPKALSARLAGLKEDTDASLYATLVAPKLDRLQEEIAIITNYEVAA